jgi:hypothetical protein
MGLVWNQVHYYCGYIIGLIYEFWMIYGEVCEAIRGMNEWQGTPKYYERICLSAALSTTDPT